MLPLTPFVGQNDQWEQFSSVIFILVLSLSKKTFLMLFFHEGQKAKCSRNHLHNHQDLDDASTMCQMVLLIDLSRSTSFSNKTLFHFLKAQAVRKF